MYKDLIPNTTIAETITSLEGEEKIAFLDFIQKMLRWLPEDRWTAKQLLEDPYLDMDAF